MEASHTFRFDPKTPPSCHRFYPSDLLIGLLDPSEARAKTLETHGKNCAFLAGRPDFIQHSPSTINGNIPTTPKPHGDGVIALWDYGCLLRQLGSPPGP